MQTAQELMNNANRHFRAADHIAYVTYPLVKDNKLIVAVLESMNNAAICIMEAMLQSEKEQKNLAIIPDNFKIKYELFRERAYIYQIEEAEIRIIQELKSLSDQRKKSDMEFVRRDKYILWDPYKGKLKELTMQSMKEYVHKIRSLLIKTNASLQNVRTV
ncbi:hypothetical protein HY500_03490 [Candidatus Woesearchaeota archaeon]|nr:hypothetical protein [Candidatus Woesearchaeota archaeon]